MSEAEKAGDVARVTALIAIGASAGGLQPIEEFFDNAPEDAGWCFVVVQHLSPDYRSMMDQILARRSNLEIAHIEEGTKIRPNTILLNPPEMLATLDGDTFHLSPYSEDQNLPHLPIDSLFRSLVNRASERVFAVIMSGSGSDGARGAAELHRAGGRVLVQVPSEARFSSMPRAAMAGGEVDRVLEAAEMPAAIDTLMNHPERGPEPAEEKSGPEGVLQVLAKNYPVDFSAFKSATVLRRIERRKQLRGEKDLDSYLDLIRRDEAALDELYQDLLIGVTDFFRDGDAIASLSRNAVGGLVDADGKELRVWVAGCATGEEAYTIAIELAERIEAAGSDKDFRIMATDVHRSSVEHAARGVFSRDRIANVPERYLEKYFDKRKDSYVVIPALRQRMIFSVHDALADPPFMRLDLISCRNLMIYLNEAAQKKILSRFIFGLKKDGYLFLGASETLGAFASEFTTVDSHWRIFRKSSDRRIVDKAAFSGPIGGAGTAGMRVEQAKRPSRPSLISLDSNPTATRDRDTLLRSYDALLKRYAPSSILINIDGEVLTWFGSASAFIDTMSDLAERRVEQIVHEDLQYSINVGIERLRRDPSERFERTVDVKTGEGRTERVTVGLETLMGTRAASGIVLVRLSHGDEEISEIARAEGSDVSASDDNSLLTRRIRELERDLRLTEESLQYVTERLETSGEELQASNEELQASNEELQASNEELQSSNEELHAVNDELVTVTSDFEARIRQLNDLNADTEAVLFAMDTGLVIVEGNLRIRRFSGLAAALFGLIEADIGRHMDAIGVRVGFADVREMVETARKTGETQSAEGEHGDETLCVRAIPYTHADETNVLLLLTGSAMQSLEPVEPGEGHGD